jgi:hydroxymethylglutaryl-CoA synthase
MTGAVGLVAFGGYVPQLRLRRSAITAANKWINPSASGKGERAFASWDEDAVTMAVEAARDALNTSSRDQIGGVLLASTTPPFADRLNAGIVAGALGLSADIVAMDVGGSMRAGTSAAIAGYALAAQTGKPVIVAAAERRRSKPNSAQELGNGDAAGALVFGSENVIAKVLATHSVTQDFVDHYRASGEPHDYGWEERWVREEGYMKLLPKAAKAVLAAAGLTGADVAKLVLPTPLGRVEAGVAKKIGIPEAAIVDSLAAGLGYAGAAHSLVQLAYALEQAKPGDRILALNFANGCDAILFEATDALASFSPKVGVSGWLANGKSTDDYMRFLSFNDEINVEWGPRAEFGNKYALTMENRFSRDMLAFIGGRDKATNVVQFPKTPMAVAPKAKGVAKYEDVSLADLSAKVIACTADWLTYHPSPPLYFGLVQFENGARVAMEFVDVAKGSIDVGETVTMTFRIKEIDRVRNYRHYFWKATPADGAATAVAEAAE